MADPLSKVFAALAEPTRRDIVARLASGDATLTQLAEPYEVSVQAVSKHVQVLEDAGLVTKTKQAQRRPVHLEAEVFDLMTKWIERYRREAEQRYQRLDAVLRFIDILEPEILEQILDDAAHGGKIIDNQDLYRFLYHESLSNQ